MNAADDPVRTMLTAPGAPFELAQVDHRGRRLRAFRNAPAGIHAILARAATFGDRDCLIEGDSRLSYAEVFARAAALKRALAARGLGRGDRIAVAMRNRPEWVIAYLAAAALGATPVLVNSRASPAELGHALTETEARALLAEPDIAARAAPEWREGKLVAVTGEADAPPGALRLDALVAAHDGSGGLDPEPMRPEDEGVVIFTSGTSGHPKGALIGQRALMNMVEAIDYAILHGAAEAGIDLAAMAAAAATQPSAMLVFPLFHTAGLIAVLLPSLRRGGRMALLRRWNAEDALALLARERIAGFSGSPTMLWDLLKADRSPHDLSALRFLSVGGQGISARLLGALARAFPQVSFGIGYGQSETGSVNGIGGRNFLARPTATGRPLPIIDLRVVDDDGRDVPPGAVGEIWIGGVTLMDGYCNRPAETAAVRRGDWLATGDLGRLDAEGFLHVSDRKKSIIVSGGENIGCGEVEAAAESHADVEQAAAYGVADERLGERLHLAVILRAGAALDEAALLAHLASRLARYKLPRAIRALDAFPLNAMGKIDRRALAAGER